MPQKKESLPPALAFLQQIQIDLGDLLDQFPRLSQRPQTLLHFRHAFLGNRDLAHPPVAETDGEDANGSVAWALALLAEATPGFMTTHHPMQQRARQDDGRVGH